MGFKFLKSLILLSIISIAAGTIQAQTFSIHLLDPWASEENGKLIHVRGGGPPGYYPGVPMAHDGGGWYSLDVTFAAGALADYNGFWFVSHNTNIDHEFLGINGIVAQQPSEADGFVYINVFEDCPDTEIWIIPDGAGPPTISCFAPDSKTIYVLNPWPSTGPKITFNGEEDDVNLSDLCGWYVYYVNEETDTYQVSFQELFTDQNYGATGLDDINPIDLSAVLATSDTVYILPTPQANSKQKAGPPEIRTTYPGIIGSCFYTLGITLRDFSAQHPDFEVNAQKQDPTPGMIETTLGPNDKPVRNSAMDPNTVGANYTQFETWFNTTSDNPDPNLRNYEKCVDLPFGKTRDGLWQYVSHEEESRGFFPLDDFTTLENGTPNPNHSQLASNYQPFRDGAFQKQWVDDPTGGLHNFHFCGELHAEFTYGPNQQFSFAGDDDVWVFINGQLVIDLGGTHIASAAEVDLDNLGLTQGETYPFDLFYCERQTTSSHLFIKTSIYFEQEQAVWMEETPGANGAITYNIKRKEGADESCAGRTLPEGITVDEEADFSINGVPLTPGQYTGLTILPGEIGITVDTAAINAAKQLLGGDYVITVNNRNNPKSEFTIPFKVTGDLELVFADKTPIDTMVGILKPVVIQATSSDIGVVQNFILKSSPGLQVFSNPDGTGPIVSGTQLTTDSSGLATVYVTGTPQAADDSTYGMSVTITGAFTDLDAFTQITYRIPRLRWVDAAGTPIQPTNIRQDAIVAGYPVYVQVYTTQFGVCLDPICLEALTLITADPAFKFKADMAGADVNTVVPAAGTASFFIYSANPSQTVTFTVQGATPGTILNWNSELIISYDVKKAWIKDMNMDGQADRVYIHFAEPVVILPSSITSIDWPNEGIEPKVGNASNISKVSDSIIMVEFAGDPWSYGQTGIKGGAIPYLTLPDGQQAAIQDSVGAVIFSADIKKPQFRRYILASDPAQTIRKMPDSLVIVLSEPIIPGPGATPANANILFRFANGCADGAGILLPMQTGPVYSGDGSQIQIPVIASPEGLQVKISDCLFFDPQTVYRDANGNQNSDIEVEVFGATESSDFNSTLLADVIGKPDISIKTPDVDDVPILDDNFNVVGTLPGDRIEQWIPPRYMDQYGKIDENAWMTCADGIETTAPMNFQPNCLSSVVVISDGAYIAQIEIFDQFGKFINTSTQRFGYCGELENPNRAHAGGYLSFLVWDQKDINGHYVGSGVYLWRVSFQYKEGLAARTVTYRQGIARSQPPIPGCALMP